MARSVDDIVKKTTALMAERDALEAAGDEGERYFKVQLEIAQGLKELAIETGDYAANLKGLEDALTAAEDALESFSEAQTRSKKAGDDFENALERTMRTLTGVTDESNTLIGSFSNLIFKERDLGKAAEKASKVFNKKFTLLNVGTSIVKKFTEASVKMGLEIDAAQSSFNRATGAGGVFNDELLDLEKSNRNLSVSIGDSTQAYGALVSEFSEFSLMSRDARFAIADTAVEMSKFGVDTSITARILETTTRQFGMTAQAGLELEKRVLATAKAMNMDLGKAAQDLAQNLNRLSFYGGRAEGIFRRLMVISKNTGLEIGELIDITNQFKTFDSAATAAGNLNAILGQQVFGTMEMLNAVSQGPDAFYNMMSQGIRSTVGEFDQLDFFLQEAIANQLGMSAAQLSAMMKQKGETDKQTAAMKRQGLTQEEFNKLMEEGRSVAEELAIVMAQFAITVQPVLEGIGYVLRGINSALQGMHELARPLAVLLMFAGVKTAIAGIASMITGRAIGATTAWHGRLLGLRATLASIGTMMGVATIAQSENKKKSLLGGLAGAVVGGAAGFFLGGGPMGAVMGAQMGFGTGAGLASMDNGGVVTDPSGRTDTNTPVMIQAMPGEQYMGVQPGGKRPLSNSADNGETLAAMKEMITELRGFGNAVMAQGDRPAIVATRGKHGLNQAMNNYNGDSSNGTRSKRRVPYPK